ncbi:MAG: hypothetical protein DWH84_03940 [Planctomycetota bacterium]|nr:MAG: hypothetical protein DWH84_03940 [Planctomycetota bacterium]
MPLNLLIVGQTQRAEAKPLVEWLSATLSTAVQEHFTDLTLALEAALRTNTIPDLIVIVQSQPDEFSSTEIARLFAFAPLARVVVAYGAWCESDGRTRHTWPLAARVSLSSAPARIEREWRLLNGMPGSEPLPLSSSREEVFAVDHPVCEQTTFEQAASPMTVLVISPDPAYRRYLNELIAAAGHTVDSGHESVDYVATIQEPLTPSPSPRKAGARGEVVDRLPTTIAILFDADPWDDSRPDQVRSLRQQHPMSNIIALMSASHPQHEAELIAAGVTSVRTKLGDQAAIVTAI